MCVSCSKENYKMDQDNFQNCTVLNTKDNIVKIYWDARGKMEFLQEPEH
jgi:hypothetical protein